MRPGAVARVHGALAVGFKNLKIHFDGRSHREWARDTIGGLRAPDHVGASLVLGLRKTEDDYAVSVAEVVGGADLLDGVGLASDIVPGDPRPRHRRSPLAAFEPAVPNMQPRLQQPVVRFAAAGETTTALSAFQSRIRSSTRHVRVQQMSNKRVRTPKN